MTSILFVRINEQIDPTVAFIGIPGVSLDPVNNVYQVTPAQLTNGVTISDVTLQPNTEYEIRLYVNSDNGPEYSGKSYTFERNN